MTGRPDAFKLEGQVAAPVAGAGHVRHRTASDQDEVGGAEVGAQEAGLDDALHDAFDDRRERRLLGVDLVPVRLLRSQRLVLTLG
jgi:hypothetical protein